MRITPAGKSAGSAPAQDASTRQPLTRLTVNLIPRANAVLELATQQTGDSKTDIVNRSLQAYAFLMEIVSRGDEVLIRRASSGDVERVIFT